MANTLLDHLREMLDEASRGLAAVTPKRMFGCYALFANGNIYGLVWKTGRIGLRVPDPAHNGELMAMAGAEPWTPGNTAMSNWILVPEGFHDDAEALVRWVKVAHGLAAAAQAKKAPARAPKSSKRSAG